MAEHESFSLSFNIPGTRECVTININGTRREVDQLGKILEPLNQTYDIQLIPANCIGFPGWPSELEAAGEIEEIDPEDWATELISRIELSRGADMDNRTFSTAVNEAIAKVEQGTENPEWKAAVIAELRKYTE